MEEQDYNLQSPLYDTTGFVPANYNYVAFTIDSSYNMPIPYGQYIIPFKHHQTTLAQLLRQLLTKLNLVEYQKQIEIKLPLGIVVQSNKTLDEIRSKLCRVSASGIALIAYFTGGIKDQAAIQFNITHDTNYCKQNVNKWFIFLNNNEPFAINNIPKTISYNKLCGHVVTSLNEQYKNNISNNDISFYKINKNIFQTTIKWQKKMELKGEQILNLIKTYSQQIIGVQVIKQNAIWPITETASEQYLILHITNQNKIKLKFASIQNFTVHQLLTQLKITQRNQTTFGIKICDEIFQPHRYIKDAGHYFKTGDGVFVKNIQCKLASQREMYYKSIRQKQIQEFEIQKQMVSSGKQNQLQKCRDLAKQRCRQIQQLSDKSEIILTSQKQISPITLYTSSIQIIDPASKKPQLLYKNLNQYLRSNRFGLNKNHEKQWKYKFSATLIKSLEKLKPYRSEMLQNYSLINSFYSAIPQSSHNIDIGQQFSMVYRGIRGHQLQGEPHQLYVAQQFMSASTQPKKAQNFVKQAEIGTFLQIKCLSGRPIWQFSLYQKQKQVLFLPYTYFRIISKDASGPIYKIKLEEIKKQEFRQLKDFKCNPVTYILWVDDKLQEGRKVINNLDCPMHTTFLHQFVSTAALSDWIKANQKIVNNNSFKKIVISNMRRIQNNQQVVDAGAHTLLLVREIMPQGQVVFYIGNKAGTIAALEKNNINAQNILIFNKRQQLKEYISKVCAPIQSKEQQEVIRDAKASILQFFSPLKQNQ